MKWTLTIALVLALAGVAAAADEVLLNAGGVVKGEIQTVDETGITVKSDDKTVTVKPGDLDVHYYYTQWAKRVPKDATAHLKLAVFAYENGLFNQARSQYRKAQSLDKAVVAKFEEEVIPRIKEGIAESLLEQTQRAIKKKDWDHAKRLAAKILTDLEDTKAAEEAREALGSIHVWQLSKDEERLLNSLTRYLPKDEAQAIKVQEKIVAKLAPVENKIRKAQDLVAKGLRTKSTNRQKDIFKTAAKRFETQIKALDKLTAAAGDDQALKAYIAGQREVAVREAIDAYVHAGSVYLIRRDYTNSLDMANKALALDPNSQHAQQFYQRTLAGSQMRGGWWGRGR